MQLRNGYARLKFGKTDYNFIWNRDDYDAADWAKRTKGQPFFAQIQLRGGKKRNTRHGTDPAKVHLPPYYPDHPVMRADWASYLDSWIDVDLEVGRILKRLEDEGIADSTVIFFWTDHGVSHARGKQFLYDEGIHVPLIARFPNDANPGVTIGDLVLHIDVAATSLALAGIEQPAYVQGLNILSKEYSGRDMVFAARDRCDETVEIIRCARTKRYKYIRNFLPHLPHLQANQYKDGKQIIKTLRQLEDQGKLTPLQRTMLATPRPREELYDLEKDPHETTNLATDPRHAQTLAKMRGALYQWMIDSRDLGLIAEPILEEMGHAYGNKYQVLQHDDHRHLVRDLLRTIDGDTSRHQQSLQDSRSAVRYWGATMLGIEGDQCDIERLSELENDPSSGVRVAAALARCRLGDAGAAKWLAQAVKHENRFTGMYAIRGLELAGPLAKPYRDVILQAQKSDYEFTRRIARRLVTNQ